MAYQLCPATAAEPTEVGPLPYWLWHIIMAYELWHVSYGILVLAYQLCPATAAEPTEVGTAW